jgi:hypothetical protein
VVKEHYISVIFHGLIALNGIFIKTVFKYWEVAVRFKSWGTETNRNAN